MTSLQDLSDMSEVSVQLEGDSAHDSADDASGDESDRSDRSDRSDDDDSEAEEFFADYDDSDFQLDNLGRLSLLGKMRARMNKSELFDEEDLLAIDTEMERVVEKEKNSLRAKMEERLRILTKFDKFLDMGNHHPELNQYFVKKQLEMQQLADNADA